MLPLDISRITADGNVPEQADPFTQEEYLDLESAQKAACLQSYCQDMRLRKKFGDNIFVFVVSWSILSMMILVCSGTKLLVFSDNILLAIITGTTVNALGLLAIVVNYLFPSNKSK